MHARPGPQDLAGVRCLYISYNGLTTPLVQAQVLPYLRRLAERGARFALLTFEGPGAARLNNAERARLCDQGITPYSLPYHQRPTLPATALDISLGIAAGALLVRRQQLNVVHARGYPPAAMALALQASLGLPFIFDVRGLLADEYADAGRWRPSSLAYRLTKRAERLLLRRADEVVVLTDRIRPVLWPRGEDAPVTTIPCCVDTCVFNRPSERDLELARALGLTGKRVLVYAGSVGTWYLLEPMLRFFAWARQRNPDWHLLIVNRGEHRLIQEQATRAGIDRSTLTCLDVPPSDVPRYLGLADVGLCFVKPSFSKLASSPTKVGEYLAVGLPVVATAGVGDLDDLLGRHGVGVLLHAFTSEAFARAWSDLETLLADPQLPSHCRHIAETELGLDRGVDAYARVYARLLESAAGRRHRSTSTTSPLAAKRINSRST